MNWKTCEFLGCRVCHAKERQRLPGLSGSKSLWGAEVPIPPFSTDSLERVKTFPGDQCGTPMLVPPYSSALWLPRVILMQNSNQGLKDALLQRDLLWCYWEQLCFS